jgi:hypothetical protein
MRAFVVRERVVVEREDAALVPRTQRGHQPRGRPPNAPCAVLNVP